MSAADAVETATKNSLNQIEAEQRRIIALQEFRRLGLTTDPPASNMFVFLVADTSNPNRGPWPVMVFRLPDGSWCRNLSDASVGESWHEIVTDVVSGTYAPVAVMMGRGEVKDLLP